MKPFPPIPSCSTENFCFHVGDYSFGFNGKELDKEGMGGGASTYDYGFRIYNSALGKFLSVDPLSHKFAFYSVYQYAGNKPIVAIDLDGLEDVWIHEYLAADGKSSQQLVYYKGTVEYDIWKQSAIETLHLNPEDIPAEGVFTTRQEWNNDGVTFELRTTTTPPCQIEARRTLSSRISEAYKKTMTKATEWFNSASDAKNGYDFEGKEGLKEYSKTIDKIGFILEATIVLAPIGTALSVGSAIIETGFDYDDPKISAGKFLLRVGIRAASIALPEGVKRVSKSDVPCPVVDELIQSGTTIVTEQMKDEALRATEDKTEKK